MGNATERAQLLISPAVLRRVVGMLGVSLPVILAAGCPLIFGCALFAESISAYYGTGMRDVLVGVLFAIGWFLFAYKGYERKDDIAGDLAGLFALLVALFPITSHSKLIRIVHLASAGALFLVLTYFALFLFTKTKPGGSPTSHKQARNRMYVACGIVMLVCVVAIAAYYALFRNTGLAAIRPVYWLETAALWAFGVSWFIKGETLWKDTGAK